MDSPTLAAAMLGIGARVTRPRGVPRPAAASLPRWLVWISGARLRA
jgi:hypothetical protein